MRVIGTVLGDEEKGDGDLRDLYLFFPLLQPTCTKTGFFVLTLKMNTLDIWPFLSPFTTPLS